MSVCRFPKRRFARAWITQEKSKALTKFKLVADSIIRSTMRPCAHFQTLSADDEHEEHTHR